MRAGGGAGLREIPVGFDHNAGVIVVAALLYCAAGLLALRIPPRHLGPDLAERRPSLWHELGAVLRGLVAGVRHLRDRPRAGYALGAIGVTGSGTG